MTQFQTFTYAGTNNMTSQLDLFAASEMLSVEARAKVILNILTDRRDWTTRKQLALYGMTDRQCREARQHSKAAIIMGQKGYKAASCATREELWECRDALKSQADAMLAEVAQLDTIIHGRPK